MKNYASVTKKSLSDADCSPSFLRVPRQLVKDPKDVYWMSSDIKTNWLPGNHICIITQQDQSWSPSPSGLSHNCQSSKLRKSAQGHTATWSEARAGNVSCQPRIFTGRACQAFTLLRSGPKPTQQAHERKQINQCHGRKMGCVQR